MKKFLLIFLTISIISSLFSISAVAKDVPNADDLNGYENVCLTYTFRTSGRDNGRHYKGDLLPYTAYCDKNGKILDFFFDSYLFLPCMDFGPTGARMHVDTANPTKALDWTTYVNDTFHEGANVDALEQAFGETKAALGNTEEKAGVFFTILYPATSAKNFGSLGGKNLDFSKIEDRKYAIKWIIDEQIKLFNENNYQHLELVGFYWLEEYLLNESDVELFQYTSKYLKSLGLKFIWIPWYCANGYNRWEQLGFDVACMQPNMYWMGNCDPFRVEESVDISAWHGLSMEIEVDARVTSDDYFNRYLYYLEGGLNSQMMNSVKMYYQDGKPGIYYQACFSSNDRFRTVYDLTYKYAKGTLTQEDIDSNRPEGFNENYVDEINMNELLFSGIKWVSAGKSYTGCASYVDGNGLAYQNVDGKELTDSKIAKYQLTTDWHAFHTSIRDNEGKMSVTVDLGEVRDDITDFAAHFDNRQDYGIGTPEDIQIYVSEDGTNFKKVAEPQLIFDKENSCFHYECAPITARYVKMALEPSSSPFVFCSEFLVGAKSDKESIISESNGEDNASDVNFNKDSDLQNKNDVVLNKLIIIAIVTISTVIIVSVVLIIIKRRKKCN